MGASSDPTPEKRQNKEGLPSAEAVEGRTSPKGNGGETAAARTLRRDNASNGLIAVRRAARQSKSVRFTALLHHITIDLLKRSYLSLERDSAPGIDGVTWQQRRGDASDRICKTCLITPGFGGDAASALASIKMRTLILIKDLLNPEFEPTEAGKATLGVRKVRSPRARRPATPRLAGPFRSMASFATVRPMRSSTA
jgi:hypothetical protein